jgi:AraC family transcriptional regulator
MANAEQRAVLMLASTWHGPPLVVELRGDEVEDVRLELLARAARERQERRRRARGAWLRDVRDLIRARIPATPSLSELAAHAGVHPAHLARTFRGEYGLTVGQYTRLLRVEWAAVQLASTDITLAELARAAHFADQSHFTRVFKRYMGVPPGAYRRAVRD